MMSSILDDIQFVVVLYKESLDNSESFRDISRSLDSVDINRRTSIYIYDNSPEQQRIHIEEGWDYEYVHDPDNSGLSVAYNRAAEFAKKKGKKWIFLLDQDTEFPVGTMKEYLRAIVQNPDVFLFAPILKVKDGKITSPYGYSLKRRKTINTVQPGVHNLNKTGPVNSGLCIGLDKFFDVGGYNERVRVDGADFQFIERYKRKFSDYYVVNVEGFQNLSLFETNTEKLLIRYKVFLSDLLMFEKFQKIDSLLFFLYGLNRAVSLTMQTKKSVFLKLFFKRYILGNK